jgi:HEAT repeat protein
MATTSSPTLLDDAQVRRFLTDGYLLLNTDVPAAMHETIYSKIQRVLNEEGNPGNNILPAVPELQQVLDSPTVRGALASVLGPNYVLHPHRFVHNNEPGEQTAEGPRVGKGSATFVGWHQDSHSPLSRPRHHYPRYAMVLYYPQHTPPEMGPTQIIPATQLHRRISDDDYERGFQASGPAGTCVLLHFDLAHGGSLNIAERTRYMAKFVFVRTEEPVAPSWDCRSDRWETPTDHQSPHDQSVIWSHLWDWMSGRLPSPCTAVEAAAIPELLTQMDGDEYARQNAIYTLAACGAAAVGPLTADLERRQENLWNESAITMESSAYALAAIGSVAVPALTALLENANEWTQINALFALGEMGPQAADAAPAIVQKLASPSSAIVRTALDALGQIGAPESLALPAIQKLLCTDHPDWQKPLYRAWTAQNQVRTNAIQALLRLGWKSAAVEQAIAAALNDPCGYVTGFGIEGLLRIGTPTALQAAVNSLRAHRWDNTLQKGVRTF